jgi:hypothetical protein
VVLNKPKPANLWFRTTFWPGKIFSFFDIKGGLLPSFHHHPLRKNLPGTTISLYIHPSHYPKLTTTLIK